MADNPISVRLGDDLREELRNEAKKQRVPEAVLIRMFVRDGLANFNLANERLLQNSEAMAEQLDLLQQLIAASLHVGVEQQVMANRQKPDESSEEFVQRLRGLYRTGVHESVAKGKLITTTLQQGTKGARR